MAFTQKHRIILTDFYVALVNSHQEKFDYSIENVALSLTADLDAACPQCLIEHRGNEIICDGCRQLLQLSVLTCVFVKAPQCQALCYTLLREQDFLEKLISCLFSQSMFVSYAAKKVFLTAIQSDVTEYFTKAQLELLFSFLVKTSATIDQMIACLDIFRGILSSKQNPNILKNFMEILAVSWESFIERFLANHMNLKYSYSFLTLWQKVFKQLHFLPTSAVAVMLESIYNILNNLCHWLTCEWALDPLLWKAAICLLNTVLHNGSMLASQKHISYSYVRISLFLLDGIVSGLYSKMPLRMGFVGFGGTNTLHPDLMPKTAFKTDLPLLRNVCLLHFRSCAIAAQSDFSEMQLNSNQGTKDVSSITQKIYISLKQLLSFVSEKTQVVQTIDNLLWLMDIFKDQDDSWVEALLALLEVYIIAKARINADGSEDHLNVIIQPHLLFLQFLQSSAYDHTVLLDLLVSPETCFLLYFTKYLKLLPFEWSAFVSSHLYLLQFCNEKKSSDKSSSVRDHIDKCSQSCCNKLSKEKEPAEESSDAVENSLMFAGGLWNYSEETTLCADIFSSEMIEIQESACEANNSLSKTLEDSPLNVGYQMEESSEPCSFDHQMVKRCRGLAALQVYSADSDSSGESEKGVEENCHVLEETFSCLIRLRLSLERLLRSRVFPYNVKPLLDLLQACEEVYES